MYAVSARKMDAVIPAAIKTPFAELCSRVGVGSACRIVALVGRYEPTAQVLLYPYTLA